MIADLGKIFTMRDSKDQCCSFFSSLSHVFSFFFPSKLTQLGYPTKSRRSDANVRSEKVYFEIFYFFGAIVIIFVLRCCCCCTKRNSDGEFSKCYPRCNVDCPLFDSLQKHCKCIILRMLVIFIAFHFVHRCFLCKLNESLL